MISSSDIESLHVNWNYLVLEYNIDLAETYKLIHQAIQFIAITGKTILPPRYDDSHTSFTWDFASKCFSSAWLHSKRTFRLEFNPVDLSIALVPYGELAVGSVQFAGKTKKEVYTQLRQILLSEGIAVHNFEYEMHYDLPEHRVCRGGKYEILNPEINEELVKHYSNAYLILSLLKAKYPISGNIRCWPHHFDITADYIEAKQKGIRITGFSVGFSPANSDFHEPHFYFIPKQSSRINLPKKEKLKYGNWLSGKLHGTSLGLSYLAKNSNSLNQIEKLSGFLNESYNLFKDQLLHTDSEKQKVRGY